VLDFVITGPTRLGWGECRPMLDGGPPAKQPLIPSILMFVDVGTLRKRSKFGNFIEDMGTSLL
jgi:hypothetical protein